MSCGVLKAMKRVNKVRQSEVKLNELIYCDCILVRMFVVESGMKLKMKVRKNWRKFDHLLF